MSATTSTHLHQVYCNYFGQGCCQLKDNKMFQEHPDEESISGSKGSVKHHMRSRDVSSIPYSNNISNREDRPIHKRHQTYLSEEQRRHLCTADKSKTERAVRQGSGFILQRSGLAHVNSDSIDRPVRKRTPIDKSNLRVNTLVLQSRSSPYYQQPLASPTSPTLSSNSLQLSPKSYHGTPSPPIQSPLFQSLSSRSQFSSYGNSSAAVTEADDLSVFDRKKSSISSASSVPSILSTHMPTNVADPVVIDWTSPSTRRREYREIDKCNRGFRRAWKTITPKCCWCKSWRPDFYVGSRGYDREACDEVDGKGGDDARSVRRYRLDLVDGNDDDDNDEENCNKGDVEHDGDFDDFEGFKDEKRDIAGAKVKGKPKDEGRTFLGLIKGRLRRTASRDSNCDDATSPGKKLKETMTKEKDISQVVKPERKEKKNKKNKVFDEGLICFQLHEIPH